LKETTDTHHTLQKLATDTERETARDQTINKNRTENNQSTDDITGQVHVHVHVQVEINIQIGQWKHKQAPDSGRPTAASGHGELMTITITDSRLHMIGEFHPRNTDCLHKMDLWDKYDIVRKVVV